MCRCRHGADRITLHMFEFGRDVSGPAGMELWRVESKRVLDRGENGKGEIVNMHQGGEILCAVTIAGHQESNRLADEANTIKGQELWHSVADARMPIAGDPRLVVEWKIAPR